jgi:hypothetical protein
MMMLFCNPSTWGEAEAGGSGVQGQPGLHIHFPGQPELRFYFKKQKPSKQKPR